MPFQERPDDYNSELTQLTNQLERYLHLPDGLQQSAIKDARDHIEYSVSLGAMIREVEVGGDDTTNLFADQPETLRQAYEQFRELYLNKGENRLGWKLIESRQNLEDLITNHIGTLNNEQLGESNYKAQEAESKYDAILEDQTASPAQIRQALIDYRQELLNYYYTIDKREKAFKEFYEQIAAKAGFRLENNWGRYELVKIPPASAQGEAGRDTPEASRGWRADRNDEPVIVRDVQFGPLEPLNEGDELIGRARELEKEYKSLSVHFLQRRLGINDSKAAELMAILEAEKK